MEIQTKPLNRKISWQCFFFFIGEQQLTTLTHSSMTFFFFKINCNSKRIEPTLNTLTVKVQDKMKNHIGQESHSITLDLDETELGRINKLPIWQECFKQQCSIWTEPPGRSTMLETRNWHYSFLMQYNDVSLPFKIILPNNPSTKQIGSLT